jgi:hypothetical protein
MLGPHASSTAEPMPLVRARTEAATEGALLFLQPELRGGSIQVAADLYPIPRRFWDRVRAPRPNPVVHIFVERLLDAELRSFLPEVPLLLQSRVELRGPERSVVALACGEVDANRGADLVVVGRRSIWVGRIRDDQMVIEASQPWSALSAVAPSPLREPLGSAWVKSGHIEVGSSDRADALVLDSQLQVLGRTTRRLPLTDGTWGVFEPLGISSVEHGPNQSPGSWDGLAAGSALDRSGRRTVWAARDRSSTALSLMDDRGQSARIEAVGAQIAVGDLDADGQPEIATTRPTLRRADDAVQLRTWLSDGTLLLRAELPAPGGVDALAMCPAPDLGAGYIVIATQEQLWFVR